MRTKQNNNIESVSSQTENPPPRKALEIFQDFIDLDRAGDESAAILALGDCIFALAKDRREVIVELVGHCCLLEYQVPQ